MCLEEFQLLGGKVVLKKGDIFAGVYGTASMDSKNVNTVRAGDEVGMG
jgi:hypothetical protein